MSKIIETILSIFTTHRETMSPSAGKMVDKEGMILDFTEWLKQIIDEKEFAIKVVDIAHSNIHEGESFCATDVVVLNEGQSQLYLIEAPAEGEIHFGYEAINNGIFTMELYEGADRTGAVEIIPCNRDFNSTIAPKLKIFKGTSDGSTDGTLKLKWAGGAVQGNSRTAVGSGSGLERILKKGTKYIFKITSGSASTTFSTRFDFYQL